MDNRGNKMEAWTENSDQASTSRDQVTTTRNGVDIEKRKAMHAIWKIDGSKAIQRGQLICQRRDPLLSSAHR